MAVTRRQFLIGAGLAAAATSGGLAACAPGAGGGGSQGGGQGKNVALAWWGNPTRNKNTDAEIAAFMAAHPDVKITAQPGEFNSYWDKLATQTAGGTAPDIIQMDMAYIADYGSRGALLDLGRVDTSKFVEGTVDSGKIDGKLVGVNAGINTADLLCPPEGLGEGQDGRARRQNLDLGRDGGGRCRGRLEGGGDVRHRAAGRSEVGFATIVRQNGKELFKPDGLGFDEADAQAWYDLMVKFQKAKALGTPEQISEEAAKVLDQSAIVTEKAALQVFNSNQLEAVSAAAGGQLMKMLRFPSLTGKAADRKAWYKASMLWSASAKTKNPDAAIAWINWFANDPAAANIDKGERGIPPNSELLAEVKPKLSEAQQVVAKFITDIQPEVANTPIAPPPGGGKASEVLFRHGLDVLFGKASTAEAAQKFTDELKSDLQV